MRPIVWEVIAFLGFWLLIGTAGASDINSLTFNRVLIQSLIGLGMLVVGFRGATETRRRRK